MSAFADDAFIQIVDAALADSVRRSGDWLACRPGCNQCCTGVFAITPADTARLRAGLLRLAEADPERAARLRDRVAGSVSRLGKHFPGDAHTGELGESEADQEAFEDFANDEICPVLDPATGTCDLYASRPLTCRGFGPPVRTGEGALGICELCFVGAPEAAITAAELYLPPDVVTPTVGEPKTIVTFALAAHGTIQAG